MTRSSQTGGGGMRGQQPITDRQAQPKRVRRGTIVTYALISASAVLTVTMLTSTPASAAPAERSHILSGDTQVQEGGRGSSPSPTMTGDMPGMDHGSAPTPASSPSPTMAGDMPGMDHGSAPTPASSPSPTMAGDMPGMDHGSAPTPGSSPAPTSSADSPWKTHDDSGTGAHSHGSSTNMPGMDHGQTVGMAKDRPLAPVLGTFGGATSAVLLSAGFLRRKDRGKRQAKQAARAARRTQK